MRIAAVMDMSFARRRKAQPVSTTPDLAVLLSEMSAKQVSSHTALTQTKTEPSPPSIVSDPLVEIFAPLGQVVNTTHSFSDKIANPVIRRKLK